MELAEPAVAALRRALDSDDLSAIVRAAIAVLDRSGFHPKQSVEFEDLTVPNTIPLEYLSIDTKRRIIAELEEAGYGTEGSTNERPIVFDDPRSA